MVRNSGFLTVATVSHVLQALVTINSARRHAPSAGYNLFLLDATADTIKKLPAILGKSGSGIKFFGPYELGSEQDDFLTAFKYYNAVEMSCLAKYQLALPMSFERTQLKRTCTLTPIPSFCKTSMKP